MEADLLGIASVSAQERMAKDGKEKAALKAENQKLRSYITSLIHGTPNVSALPTGLLDLPAEQNHRQLITFGKHLRDQVEEFVLKGRCILANLYQLRDRAHGLHAEIQQSEQRIAEKRLEDESTIVDLQLAYQSVYSEENKQHLFAWKEQLAYKVKAYDAHSVELIDYRRVVATIINFARMLVISFPCMEYQREGGEYVEMVTVQNQFRDVIRSTFFDDPDGCKLAKVAALSTKFEEAASQCIDFENQLTTGEIMLRRHVIILQSINSPEVDEVNQWIETLLINGEL